MKGQKRPNNCFKCWHCSRIDGKADCCVCNANVTKKYPPDIIYEPYKGICNDFLDKSIIERQITSQESEQTWQKS